MITWKYYVFKYEFCFKNINITLFWNFWKMRYFICVGILIFWFVKDLSVQFEAVNVHKKRWGRVIRYEALFITNFVAIPSYRGGVMWLAYYSQIGNNIFNKKAQSCRNFFWEPRLRPVYSAIILHIFTLHITYIHTLDRYNHIQVLSSN